MQYIVKSLRASTVANVHTRVVTKLVCMICFLVKESDSDTVIMVIILVVGVGGIFLLFAIMALCYR
jgi:hypothetical protein